MHILPGLGTCVCPPPNPENPVLCTLPAPALNAPVPPPLPLVPNPVVPVDDEPLPNKPTFFKNVMIIRFQVLFLLNECPSSDCECMHGH